jgi:hypothetical protein
VIQGNATKINKCVGKVPCMTILFFNYEQYDMRARNKVEWDLWKKMEHWGKNLRIEIVSCLMKQ